MTASPPAPAPAPAPPRPARRLHPLAVPAALAAVAAAWRLWLTRVYAGWEEGDFGYLALTRGVLESRFTHWEMDETPLYFVLSAAAMAVLGDARAGTLAVSLASGVAAVVLGHALARRLFGARVAAAAGLALAFQPELSLYSATAMREPLYAALVLAAWLALTGDRPARAGALLGASVLVRFDTLAANLPAAVVQAARSRRGARAALAVAGVALGVAAAFSVYCRLEYGTFRFWAGAVARNLADASGQELASAGDRARMGLGVAAAMLVDTLPRHLGWPLVAGAAWHGWSALRGRVRGTEAALALAVTTNVGVWLGLGFVARYDPGHNLYWKWLLMPAALVCVTGPRGLELFARDRLGRSGSPARVMLAASVVATLAAFAAETAAQVRRSHETVAPYVDLGRWIEREVPEPVPMVVDGIPRMWLERRANARPMASWEQVPTRPGDPEAFGAWLAEGRYRYVLWLAEEWTGAPRAAPFLAQPVEHRAGPAVLTPLRADPRAGFVFYRVEGAAPR